MEALGQHHVEGRLTAEELAERTERAYAAFTLLIGWQAFSVFGPNSSDDAQDRRR